jgi:predicted dehydrogenase/threonine dehydrogenase-like Zn-dependent dehydrogenase
MKQVVQDFRAGTTSVIDVPVPQLKPNMALVRNSASLVSVGTERALVAFASKNILGKARSRPDLVRQVVDKARREGILTTIDAVRTRLDQPLPLGYSSAGTIVQVGPGLADFQVGDRVACAGGGHAVHAEYVLVPKNLLAKIPENVDFEAAAFTTLGSIALHGFRLANPTLGEFVAVIGLGVLGLLAGGVARAAGCKVFGIDVDPDRVAFAQQLGFAAVARDEAESAALGFTKGMGFDVVQICADTTEDDTVILAGEITRDRGRVISTGVVGIGLPRKTYFEKELSFIVSRSYGPGRYDKNYEEEGVDYPIGYVRWTEQRNLSAFLEILATEAFDVHPLISHRFPIERAEEAYALLSSEKAEPFLGVVIAYPGSEADVEPLARKIVLSTTTADGSDEVRLGVIGAGNFAKAVMLPIMQGSGVQRVGLTAATGISATETAKRFGFEYAATESDEILADDRVNAVAILTRHDLHAPLVLQALKADKHVFCEKPLAIVPDDLRSIAKALEGSDRILAVGFNRRFAPYAAELKKFLLSVNEPLIMNYRVNAGLLPQDHWLHDPAQGGGRIIGEGCHFIDFLSFVASSPIKSIMAKGTPSDDRYREDNVILMFKYQNGSVGTITYVANGDRSLPKERLEVFGGGSVAILDDFRRLELISDGRKSVRKNRWRQDKGHRPEWEAFMRAVREGGPPPIPYQELFDVSLASILALDALRSGSEIQFEPMSQP